MSQKANASIAGISGAPGFSYPEWQAIIPGVTSVVSITGSSAQSVAFQTTTTIVRLCVSTDCWVKFGVNPTADKSASIFMPSGSVEYFGVTPGQKVAGLQDSAGGNLSICEGS